jgi:uncharacterized sulfatase
LHTALIARLPGVTAAGKRTDALVQYADVLPTLLDLAGSPSETGQHDGSSFLPVLKGEKDSHRKFVYGMHNNIPEGPAYPIRTVTDGTWRYIRNLTPDELYIEKHLMGLQGRAALNNPYWATWIWDSHSNSRTYDLVKRYMRRPAEQLYRTANDPFEMTNLAGEKDQSAVLNRLSKELDRWMASQGDPGIPQDTQQSIGAARRGKHRFFPPDTP